MESKNNLSIEEQLIDAKKKLEILMENMPGGVIIYEAKTGKIHEVSKSLLDMFGCSEEAFREHYYNSFDLLIYKNDRARIKDLINQQMEFMSTVEVTFRAKDLMGETKYLEFKGKVMPDRDGIQMFYAILSDVSERMLVQQELQHINETLYMETQRYKLLQDAVDDIPFDYNVLLDSLEVTLKNHSNNRLQIDDFYSECHYKDYISDDTLDKVIKIWDVALADTKKGTVECKIRSDVENAYEWYRIYFVSFQDKSGRIVRIVGSLKNIDQEKKEQENLAKKLSTDTMTGILNKASMQNLIGEYILLSKNTDIHALFMIDTDNFKSVNDTLGHLFGDEVIKLVASTIKDTFRDSDFVGRVGGDEFMVFMKNTTREAAANRAAALNQSMRRIFEKDGKSVSISCSIGVAFFSKDGADFDALYQNADACLYEAKRRGKDRCILSDMM